MNRTLYTFFITFLFLSTNLSADCEYELFNISSTQNTSIREFINRLAYECDYTVIINDKATKKRLNEQLGQTKIINLTIEEVLNLILREKNLSYSLEDNVLKIKYIETKTYHIDYLITQRKSSGRTNVTLNSSSQSNSTESSNSSGAGGSGSSLFSTSSGSDSSSTSSSNNAESGSKITSTDEVVFWDELDNELHSILNRPEDNYKAPKPIINKNAGLITISATYKQHLRVKKYIDELQKKMQHQVLIDVHMYSVAFSKGNSTGIDWSQIYSLQNIKGSFSYGDNTNAISTTSKNGFAVNITGDFKLNEVVKFLKEQGSVTSISNPKILTLNNQPALITVGTEFFYKIQASTLSQGTNGGVAAQTQNENVQSVFAGVLLDITPEISNDNTITLKINPSLSQTREEITTTDGENRTIPPDLDRRQLSSVVMVKDGNQIILGGLINSRRTKQQSKVPLLGDIPGLNFLFSYESDVNTVEELVIIIEPHIISKEKNRLSLKDLGFTDNMNKNAPLRYKDSVVNDIISQKDNSNDE